MLDAVLTVLDAVISGLVLMFPEQEAALGIAFAVVAVVWFGLAIKRRYFRTRRFTADVSSFTGSSTGPVASYLRIMNVDRKKKGHATVTVIGSAGDTLGTFKSAVIKPHSTLQLSASDIETGANLPSVYREASYSLVVKGHFHGAVKHLLFDGKNVQFADTVFHQDD